PYSKGTGLGMRAPDRVVRAMILCRLTNYVDGWAAISPEVAQRVADKLDGRPLPEVGLEGPVGAGEVGPCLAIIWDLVGPDCGEKDGGCLINGSPCASALIGDAALRARTRLDLVCRVLALSIEAVNAPLEAYDPALAALWDDEHEAAALAALNGLLAGARPTGRRAFQAPVSWRVIPRVLGQTFRAVAEAERVATVALRAITDNPVYLQPEPGAPFGRALSTGGYHNGAAYPALNWLAMAWGDLTGIVLREITKLHRNEVTELPDRLPLGEGGSTSGLAHGPSSLGVRVREFATPTFLPQDESGSTQDDVAAPTFDAYVKEVRASEMFDHSLALLAATASQALAVAGRDPAPPLRPFLAGIRRTYPLVDGLRDLGADGDRLAAALSRAVVSGDLDLTEASS
ncbi:MAG: aromatic amino acid lyase, partial [Alphaproteobacteria bacterium]